MSSLNRIKNNINGIDIDVNAGLNVTGNTMLHAVSADTMSLSGLVGTANRIVEASSGGTISASKEMIDGYINNSTTILLLVSGENWTINGVYTGATISDTYQGQTYVDDNYMYYAIANNSFVRLIRG